jgi:hypothetical protein
VLPLLLLTLLGTSGCYAVRYSSRDLDAAARRSAVVHKTWSHSLVWGLASANEVKLDEICGPVGAAEMRSHYGPFGLFAQVISLGFWTPMRVKVTCNPPDAPMIAAAPPPPPMPAAAPLAVPAGSTPPPPATSQGDDRVIVIPDDNGRTVIIVQEQQLPPWPGGRA